MPSHYVGVHTAQLLLMPTCHFGDERCLSCLDLSSTLLFFKNCMPGCLRVANAFLCHDMCCRTGSSPVLQHTMVGPGCSALLAFAFFE